MVTVNFQPDQLVVITFSGNVTSADVEEAWASFANSKFSSEHDVIVDARGAIIDFPVVEVVSIVSRRDDNLRGATGITCFLVDSELARAVVTMVRGILARDSRWHFVADLDEARSRIAARRSA